MNDNDLKKYLKNNLDSPPTSPKDELNIILSKANAETKTKPTSHAKSLFSKFNFFKIAIVPLAVAMAFALYVNIEPPALNKQKNIGINLDKNVDESSIQLYSNLEDSLSESFEDIFDDSDEIF